MARERDEGAYLIGLGSNVRHRPFGAPADVLRAAFAALAAEPGIAVVAVSPIVASVPLGPSRRRYANAAAILDSALEPPALLGRLQGIEARFGRKRLGQRWGARVLDLDIVLWGGGPWVSPGLVIPHPAFRHRAFVLAPAAAIASRWRDPLSGLTLRQLRARLARAHSAPPLARPCRPV